jgi:uncharacterized protein (DUF2147 family)
MKTYLLVLFFVLVGTSAAISQTVVGKWKTVDDKTGKVRSIVEIREQNGEMYGKVIQLFRPSYMEQNPKCYECEDDRKDQYIIGMDVIRNMKWNGSMYKGGNIIDPDDGTIYRCEMWLSPNNVNELQVRGYWGIIYRTQTWYRVP